MEKPYSFFQIFGIITIFIISLSGFFSFDVYAQIIVDGKRYDCGKGTYYDNTTNSCKLICPDGLTLEGQKCIIPKGFLDLTDNAWIGWGVLLAGIIAGMGIGITLYQQSLESKKRTHEIIQSYSTKITEITNKENNLKTKQDCALYAEQYLDTMEEISTLALAGNFRKGMFNKSYEHVTDYFNNNFAYGYDLWWWYHRYIHGFDDDMQNRLWTVPKLDEPENANLDEIYTPQEIDALKLNPTDEYEALGALKSFHKDDRWPDFRRLCNERKITEFIYNYKGIDGKDDSKKNWRVLPDLMYYEYDKIPDEDGLTKAEYVEILREFANDLSNFVEKEKDLDNNDDYEVYAEQYLETLEQIATLYRHGVLPTKESSYFENKFAYGHNIWDWYHLVVLKFSKNFADALWELPLQNPIDSMSNESITEKFQELKYKQEIRRRAKPDSVSQNELDNIIESIVTVNRDYIIEKGADSFDFLMEKARKNSKKADDEDICQRLIRTVQVIKDTEIQQKIDIFFRNYNPVDENNNQLENLKNIFKLEHPDIKKIVIYPHIKPLIEEYFEQNQAPPQLPIENAGRWKKEQTDAIINKEIVNMDPKTIKEFLKNFIIYYLSNERWKDFRWWCKKEGITAFFEDPSEGLILPKKMWEAEYD